MEPRLLPAIKIIFDSVDYTQSIITRRYKLGEAEYYFTLHPELYPEEDALQLTGRYLAVILTPQGLRAFYLVKNAKGKYIVDDEEEDDNRHPSLINVRGYDKLKNLNSFISVYLEAVNNEIKHRMIFIRHCLKMMEQAIAEAQAAH